MLRYILLPILVLSLIIAAIYSLSILREGGSELSGDAGSGRPQSVSVMDGVRVVSTTEGERQWMLSSRRIEITGGSASLDGVEATVIGLAMEVSAPSGIYDMDSGELDLEGNVMMTGSDYTVSSTGVSLDPGTGSLSSGDDVVIDGNGFRITGSGLLAAGREIRLISDVKAVFY